MQELEKLVMAALCSSGVLAQGMPRENVSWLVKFTGMG